MESYTMGTASMIAAMLRALPEHYEMSLNRSDMATVIEALSIGAGFWQPTDEDFDRMTSLFSSIAETLGVEGI